MGACSIHPVMADTIGPTTGVWKRLGVRVLRPHSLKTRPASKRRAWSGPRQNVALCAGAAHGTVCRACGASLLSASRRITDTMPASECTDAASAARLDAPRK